MSQSSRREPETVAASGPRVTTPRFEDLRGMVVVLTGGSQGQGEAEARLFAAAGARVFIADVADERGEGVAAEIGGSYCHVDVSNATAWRDLMGKVMDAHGRLDVLVNNAAVHWF